MGTGPYTLVSYTLDFFAISFWWRRVTGVVRTAAGLGSDGAYWLDERGRRTVVAEARIYVALWMTIAAVSILLRSWAAVSLWIGPMLATKWFHQLQNAPANIPACRTSPIRSPTPAPSLGPRPCAG